MMLSSLALLALLAPPSATETGITDRLAAHLAEVSAHAQVSAIAIMRDQFDVQELAQRTARLARKQRAQVVKAQLLPFAEESQRELDQQLAQLKKSGEVTFSHRLWTVNAMRITGTKAAIEKLAAVPGVDRMRWDPKLLDSEMQDVAPPIAYTIGEAPFGTSFETAAIPAEIDAPPVSGGRIQTTASFGPSQGLLHLGLDASAAGPEVLLSAELHINLAGTLNSTLSFDAQSFGNGGSSQGLFVSVDGIDYFPALSFPDDSPYQNYSLNVAQFLRNLGLSKSSNVRFRFRWGATDSLPTSGLTLDNIQVRVTQEPVLPPEPNIIALQADQLWALGIDGRGSFILNTDSGTANDHPDLASSIWCNPGEIAGNGIDDDNNGFIDDVWGWDFASNDNFPYDGGHGTNTAGIVVGNGSSAGGVRTGMAPRAIMAVAKISGEGDALASYQYGIDIGVDVITSSHSYKWPSQPDYHLFRASAEVELAAGVIHSNSLGNQGTQTSSYPIPFNISAPGLCPGPWRHPNQVDAGLGSIMGCAGIFVGSDALYTSSGQGPSAWEDLNHYSAPWPHPQNSSYWDYPYEIGTSPGLLKPDVATYTNVKTTAGSSGYNNSFGGTSAATPHLGGALCLLVDANERALPRQLSHALQASAFDLGPAGKDLRYGAGKVQVYDAALRIISLVTAVPQSNLVGETSNIEISGPQGSPYVLILGLSPGMIPTTFGFSVEVAPPLFLDTGVHTGYSTPTIAAFTIPNDPAFSGLELFLQVVTDDTLGWTGQWLISLLETVRWD